MLKELDKTKTFQRERSYLLIHDTTVHIAAVKNAWKLILKVAHFVAFIYSILCANLQFPLVILFC